ncbi:MAG: hypothetical protein ACYDCL_00135 [Myxococcales bacterium]
MVRTFAVAALWAWTGFASCEDPDRVRAAVNAEVAEPGAVIDCHEPRLWYSEKNWYCRSYVRGTTRCFELHSLEEGRPWEVECRKESNEDRSVIPGMVP